MAFILSGTGCFPITPCALPALQIGCPVIEGWASLDSILLFRSYLLIDEFIQSRYRRPQLLFRPIILNDIDISFGPSLDSKAGISILSSFLRHIEVLKCGLEVVILHIFLGFVLSQHGCMFLSICLLGVNWAIESLQILDYGLLHLWLLALGLQLRLACRRRSRGVIISHEALFWRRQATLWTVANLHWLIRRLIQIHVWATLAGIQKLAWRRHLPWEILAGAHLVE